ncbi:Chromatin structure-remodeling complex protein rsc9 [Blastocladiella emersonii ATCC 22665]|nr:Chromatin structure-remodeling complex protein rsc9 [Blastocladiella emersonii ATCC 22665]
MYAPAPPGMRAGGPAAPPAANLAQYQQHAAAMAYPYHHAASAAGYAPAPAPMHAGLLAGGFHNRALLALHSTLPNEIDWALSSLCVVSATPDRDLHLQAVPGLLDKLLRLAEDYLHPPPLVAANPPLPLYPRSVSPVRNTATPRPRLSASPARQLAEPSPLPNGLAGVVGGDDDDLILSEDPEAMDADAAADADMDEDALLDLHPGADLAEDEDGDDEDPLGDLLFNERELIDLERGVLIVQTLRNFALAAPNAAYFASNQHLPRLLLRLLRLPEQSRFLELRLLALDTLESIVSVLPIQHSPVQSGAVTEDQLDDTASASATAAVAPAAAAATASPPNAAAAVPEQGVRAADLFPILYDLVLGDDRALILGALSVLAKIAHIEVHEPALVDYYHPQVVARVCDLLLLAADHELADRALEFLYQWTFASRKLAKRIVRDTPRTLPAALLRLVRDGLPESRAFENPPAPAAAAISASRRERMVREFEGLLAATVAKAAAAAIPAPATPATPATPSTPTAPTTPATIPPVPVSTATTIVVPPHPFAHPEPLRALAWVCATVDVEPHARTACNLVHKAYTDYVTAASQHIALTAANVAAAADPTAPVVPHNDPNSPAAQMFAQLVKSRLNPQQLFALLANVVPGLRVTEQVVYGLVLRPSSAIGATTAAAPTNPPGGFTTERRRAFVPAGQCLWAGCTAACLGSADALAQHVEAVHLASVAADAAWPTCPWGRCTVSGAQMTAARWLAHLRTHIAVPAADPPTSPVHAKFDEAAAAAAMYPHMAIQQHITEEVTADPVGVPFTAALVLRNLVRGMQWLDADAGADDGGAGPGAGSAGGMPYLRVRDDLVLATAAYPRISKVLGLTIEEMA